MNENNLSETEISIFSEKWYLIRLIFGHVTTRVKSFSSIEFPITSPTLPERDGGWTGQILPLLFPL